MADADSALTEQIFHVSRGEWKTNIHHHRELNDLRRCFRLAKRILDLRATLEQGG